MQGLIQFTERFGNMLSRALLTVLYYFVLGPFAVLYRMFADPLHIRKRESNWTGWSQTGDSLNAARRQD